MNRAGNTGGFLEELKRRNVFRVAVAYLVSAWLLLQVADIVLENIAAPDWVIQVFMLGLGMGLPIALIFAWAFELTPEGIKREKDVDRSQSITHKTGRKLDFTIIGILAVAVLVLLIDRFRGPVEPASPEPVTIAEETEAPAPSEPSIAVLPFVNMSSDPEQEYFSDGISEEILNALARVRELKVAGRTSSFAFKGKDQDLRQIGETLGVEHILEGSVRKSGATVRITAQLIQVDDGFHLWSDTYDRELTNVFEIQDEIATAILDQLKAHLIGLDSAPAPGAAQRTDPVVYEQYLLAKQRIYERKRLSIESAVALLDKAIAKDPAYAPAYAQRGIAALLLSEYNYGDTKQAEAEIQARLYLDKALQLDPELAEGWSAMGLYHINRPGESPQGIEALQKALAINPNLIDASNWLQIAYGNIGDNARALQILEGMVERDPLYPPGFGNAVNIYNVFGLHEKSLALLDRIRPFLPGDPQLLQSEANTWMAMGQPSKAIPLLEAALETQSSDAVMRQFFGWGLLATGQYERVLVEGHPWHKAFALNTLERPEEALMIGRKQASEGEVSTLINTLNRTSQHRLLIEFIESRWPDLAAFEAEYPDGGTGFGEMIAIARAYSLAGNQSRFDDAMARVRAAHEKSLKQGVKVNYFLANHARFLALAGDERQAIDTFSEAVEAGWIFAIRPESVWPEMQTLAGDPAYEAVLTRMVDSANTERAALGLEPIST
ncbi:tetratricopeptide repeat protein [Elongatibacter sediminis]|uniref:Tetratricopeptide repeat protein n=1 Tax=Elongatibacter sediminis TaxID=3119006 RepID=A0AAW9RCJ0_9GAMM